jgi:NADPH-dependent curcumin reductase CurA
MQCRLAARPVGLPKPTDWTFTEEPVPSPADGELLVRVEYLSIDPAMRTWMNAGRSYVPPVEIGEVHLGVLGISGLTAYFGLLDVGRPEPGQTVVISGAAGSVGSIAGQIARIKGCRAVGIAGGPEKCRWLVEELGFDAAIDYKAGDLRAQLKTHAPNGVMCSPTTSAARRSRRRWRGSPVAVASCCAAPFRSTTPPPRSVDRPTTCSCSSRVHR